MKNSSLFFFNRTLSENGSFTITKYKKIQENIFFNNKENKQKIKTENFLYNEFNSLFLHFGRLEQLHLKKLLGYQFKVLEQQEITSRFLGRIVGIEIETQYVYIRTGLKIDGIYKIPKKMFFETFIHYLSSKTKDQTDYYLSFQNTPGILTTSRRFMAVFLEDLSVKKELYNSFSKIFLKEINKSSKTFFEDLKDKKLRVPFVSSHVIIKSIYGMHKFIDIDNLSSLILNPFQQTSKIENSFEKKEIVKNPKECSIFELYKNSKTSTKDKKNLLEIRGSKFIKFQPGFKWDFFLKNMKKDYIKKVKKLVSLFNQDVITENWNDLLISNFFGSLKNRRDNLKRFWNIFSSAKMGQRRKKIHFDNFGFLIGKPPIFEITLKHIKSYMSKKHFSNVNFLPLHFPKHRQLSIDFFSKFSKHLEQKEIFRSFIETGNIHYLENFKRKRLYLDHLILSSKNLLDYFENNVLSFQVFFFYNQISKTFLNWFLKVKTEHIIKYISYTYCISLISIFRNFFRNFLWKICFSFLIPERKRIKRSYVSVFETNVPSKKDFSIFFPSIFTTLKFLFPISKETLFIFKNNRFYFWRPGKHSVYTNFNSNQVFELVPLKDDIFFYAKKKSFQHSFLTLNKFLNRSILPLIKKKKCHN